MKMVLLLFVNQAVVVEHASSHLPLGPFPSKSAKNTTHQMPIETDENLSVR